MSNPLIKFYYATWCGYCKAFKPELNILIDKYGEQVKKYEHSIDKDTIMKDGIEGYPTIRILHKDGSYKEWKGPRNANAIINYISENNLEIIENFTNDKESINYNLLYVIIVIAFLYFLIMNK